MEKAVSGFNLSGIFSFNPDKYTKEDFEAVSQYTHTVSDDLDPTNYFASSPSTSHIPTTPQSCPKEKLKPTSAFSREKLALKKLSLLPSYFGKGKTKKVPR